MNNHEHHHEKLEGSKKSKNSAQHENHDHYGHGAHKEKEAHGAHSHHDHHQMMVEDFKFRFWWVLALTIPILALSPMIQDFLSVEWRFTGDTWTLFGLSTIVFFFGGWPFLTGLIDELKSKQPGMMTLVGLAISVAYIYSVFVVFGLDGDLLFWELSTLVAVMLLGHWIEMRSVMSASNALEKLAELLPGKAHRVNADGSTEDVLVEELRVGDYILIKPGEKVPADGIVVEGKTNINEAMLTGESLPVEKQTADEVIGGSINEEGSIKVKIHKTGDESFLSQVIDLVRQAQESKSRTQDLANRAAFWLTIVAITGGLLTFFAWSLFTGQDLSFAIKRTVTVMVIACPHALGLAIPLVVAVSTTLASTNGFLIRNRTAFEEARDLGAVIFDKTGTLTEGTFTVTDILNFNGQISDEDLLNYAAAVEGNSEHPIARGIVEKAGEIWKVENFNSITGKGVEGNVNGKSVKVVSPGYIRDEQMEYPQKQVEGISSQGKTVVFVILDGELHGAVALGDKIRPESREAIDRLHNMGIQCVMLTGDNRQTAEYVAGELGIDQVFAEVLPDEKAEKIKEVQQQGMKVAMTGDGVNDAPALASADVGIAIGAGSDVAVETGDIVLVRNSPVDVAHVIQLSKVTYGKMVQNLFWATGYNVIAIPLAAGVLFAWGIILSPAMGAVLMSLSTVIVAINARFLKIEKESKDYKGIENFALEKAF